MLAGYRVPVPTSSTLALYDSFENNNRIQLVSDQAIDRGFHHGDAEMTSSTGSQSPPAELRDVIVVLFIFAASVMQNLYATSEDA